MPFTKNVYYMGAGKVFIGVRNADGTRGVARFVGNAPEFKIGLELEKEEIQDSTDTQRLVDLVLVKQRKATFSLSLYSLHLENMELMVYGTKRTISSGSASAEAAPNPVEVGDYWKLKHENVSSVVITDSAGSPATLTLGTHYIIDDAGFGRLKIVNLASFTQPLKAAYSYAQRSQVPIFDTALTERFVEFHGINSANGDKKVLFELYRTQIDPAKDIGLLNNEAAKFELEGTALYDVTRDDDPNLGAFGRVSYVDAP